MNYTELLNRTIKKSGLKNIEIIEKLKDENISITANYLSVLRNDNTKIASNELSKALAKVCGANEDLLVIQAELDKAGEQLNEYIRFSLEQITSSVKFALDLTPEPMRAELKKKYDDNFQCDADIICDIINNEDSYKSGVSDLFSAIPRKQQYALVPIAPGGKVEIVDNVELENS